MPLVGESWINVPAGSKLIIACSSAGNSAGSYAVHAHVHYVHGVTPPPDVEIPKADLDPGPAVIPVRRDGTVVVTMFLTRTQAAEVDVTVTGWIEQTDGSRFGPDFSAVVKLKTSGEEPVLFTATGVDA